MGYERYIVIGDVHGCLEELVNLLNECNYDETKDCVILAGDLVDRGPDSVGVVRFARENGLHAVCGNHDSKYVRFRKHERKAEEDPKYRNPMVMKGEKEHIYSALTSFDLDWMTELPAYIFLEECNTYIVHAGCLPHIPIPKTKPSVLMHARFIHKESNRMLHLGPNFSQPNDSILWDEAYNGEEDIVYGHNVFSDVRINATSVGSRTIGIDTGAVFGGKLTALILTKDRYSFVSVPSREYCDTI